MRLFVLIFLISSPALAEDFQQDVKSDMRGLVDRLDELVGGTRTDDNKSTSSLRLKFSEEGSRFKPYESAFAIKFTLKLGRLEVWQEEANDWLRRKWEHLKEDFGPSNKSGAAGPAHDADLAAARKKQTDEQDPWRFSLQKHVAVKRDPDFWAEGRLAKDFENSWMVNSFFSQISWSLHRLWSAQAGLSNHKKIAEKLSLSFSNGADWRINEKTFGTSHGPALGFLLADNQALVLSAGVSTSVIGHRTWAAESYVIGASYHLQAWSHWIHFVTSPYLEFARHSRFAGDPGVTVALELLL